MNKITDNLLETKEKRNGYNRIFNSRDKTFLNPAKKKNIIFPPSKSFTFVIKLTPEFMILRYKAK